MDLLSIIKGRRSIRSFLSRALPDEIISQLVEALIWAPSAGNLQRRKFYFIFNGEIKRALARAAYGQDFIYEAPLAIVGCLDKRIEWDYGRRGRDLYAIQDVSASIQNLLLIAHALGLGTVWVGAFNEERVSEILKLPHYLRPVAIVPVGYPAEKPSPPPRVSAEEAVEFIR